MSAPQVVVVGDLVTDVVAQLGQPLAVGSDAQARIRSRGGGSAGNVAAWLAEAGATVALVARIGADETGRRLAQELADRGVELHLAVDDDLPTGTVVVIVTPDGERTMLSDRGANLRLSPADIPPKLLAESLHLHLSGYTLLDDGPRAAGLEALRLVSSHGATTSVDPSSVQPLMALGPHRFLELTAGVGLCVPNLAEAQLLTGARDPDEAARRLADAFAEVVVTLAVDGAVWSGGGRSVRGPAVPAEAIDTTGAGDAFTAGYLAARLAGAPVEERLLRGAELAARAVQILGGRP